MQILKGLFQVGGDLNGVTFDQPGALWNDANSYVLQTSSGLVMFDCGCGDTMDQIFTNMRYWDLSPRDIRYCLLTHPHLDHSGGAWILEERGVELIAGRETAEAIASGDERCAGYLYHKKFRPATITRKVQNEELLSLGGTEIRVMHLPGHSRGCTAYLFEHEGREILVSGDIIGTQLSGYFGWDGSIDFDKPAYIESLRRLAREDPQIMLPGHGLICFHKPRWRIEESLNSALIEWR